LGGQYHRFFQVKKVTELTQRVEDLEQQVLELKSKKDSNNSSIPPSQDQGRENKNKSLRKKVDVAEEGSMVTKDIIWK
jgi:cell division septum initiation protein DivIVA